MVGFQVQGKIWGSAFRLEASKDAGLRGLDLGV